MSEKVVVEAHNAPELLTQIGRAAEQADLGAHRSAHPAGRSEHQKNLRFLGIATPVLAVVTGLGVLMDGNWWFLTGLVTVGFALGLVGNLITGRKYFDKDRGIRLDLYARGLIYAQASGLRVVRYDRTSVLQANANVRRVGEKKTIRTIYRYTLTDLNGSQFSMDGVLANPQDWGPAIQNGVVEAQVAPTWTALEAGQRVEFGTWWMTRSELGCSAKPVPWSEIGNLTVHDGVVFVGVDKNILRQPRIPVSKIHNFALFYMVAERLCSIHGREAGVR